MMKKAIRMRSKGRRPALFAVFASLLFAALLSPVGLSAASATGTPTPGPDTTDYLDSHQITPSDLGLPADSQTPMSGKVDVSHLWSLPTGTVVASYADVQTASGKFNIQSDVKPSITFNVRGKVEATHGKGLPGLTKDGVKSLDLVPFTYTGTDPMTDGITRVGDGTTAPYVWNSTSEFISHTEHFRWTSTAPSRGLSVWSTFIDGSSWTLAFAPVNTGGGGGGGGDVDGSITGNVAKDGAGVSGVKADLFQQNADGTRGPWVESAHTDAAGNVTFDDVAPGCYVITYTAPTGETFADGSRWLNQSICVDDNEEASLPAVDLTGSTGGGDEASIGGTVGRDGTGVAGVKADLYTANDDGTRGAWLGSRTTDDDGSFTFSDVAPGCYVVTFTAANGDTFVNGSRWTNEQVCVDADEQVGGVNATLAGGTIDTAGTIAGSADKNGAPAPGVKVDLYVANADGTRGTWLGSELTDGNGDFSFDPVNPGCYVLTYTAPDGETFTNGSRWLNQTTCVGDNEDVQVPAVDVQGTIVPDNRPPTMADIDDQEAQQGAPVSIQAQASDPDNDPITYSATGLPAGVSIDPNTGLISGTPTESGVFTVQVSATDPSGEQAVTSFDLTVTASCTPQAGQLPLIDITPELLGLPATTSHAKSGSVDLSSQWDLSAGSIVLKYYYVRTSNGKFVFSGLNSSSIFKLYGSTMTFAVTHDASIGGLKKEGVYTLDHVGLNYTGASVSYPLYSYGAGSSYAYVYNKSWHTKTSGGDFQWTTAKPTKGITVFGAAPHGGSAFYSVSAAPNGTVCS